MTFLSIPRGRNLPKRSVRMVGLFGAAVAWASSNVNAQPASSVRLRRVLVLYSDERLLPANLIADEAIRATFAAESQDRIEFHREFLDVSRVELAMEDRELRLAITDHGVGFEPETKRVSGSPGLVSMTERARFAHGRLSVESHAGKGTRIDVRMPIAATEVSDRGHPTRVAQ